MNEYNTETALTCKRDVILGEPCQLEYYTHVHPDGIVLDCRVWLSVVCITRVLLFWVPVLCAWYFPVLLEIVEPVSVLSSIVLYATYEHLLIAFTWSSYRKSSKRLLRNLMPIV